MTAPLLTPGTIPAQLLRHDLLSHGQEIELALRWEVAVHAAYLLAEANCQVATSDELGELVALGRNAREVMVIGNLRLVAAIAREAASSSPVPVAELFAEGVLGLLDAVDRFDHRRGVRLGAWVAVQARSRISTAVCTRAGELPIGVAIARRRSRRVNDGAGFESVLGPAVPSSARTDARRCDHLPVPIDQVAEPSDPIADTALLAVIDRATGARLLGRLAEDQRRVVELRFGFTGAVLSRPATARQLGISVPEVRQLETQALARLRRDAA
ncbi:sigma-70 family RNA polymerase sigma factor [Naumannella halotolerans]|uniref:RNA polymerase primary sigma factor n=1 Tax=Naumannella halotolerans TaxID=993414 RepID=A0A4R7JB53_9ACTN|nr:sigma-70 family RNA polymerase sigma factor [Naumannella halotolerans]TDT33823.1 RNA polymerase primary sigma factor [Naumannella halotolerans]